jgi:hypothetical protein
VPLLAPPVAAADAGAAKSAEQEASAQQRTVNDELVRIASRASLYARDEMRSVPVLTRCSVLKSNLVVM